MKKNKIILILFLLALLIIGGYFSVYNLLFSPSIAVKMKGSDFFILPGATSYYAIDTKLGINKKINENEYETKIKFSRKLFAVQQLIMIMMNDIIK